MGAHDGGDGCVCDRLKYVEAALAEAKITIVDRETLLVGAQKAYNKDLADLQAKLAELQVKVKYNANRELADYERIKALKQERDLLRSVNKDLQSQLAAAEKGSDHWEKLAMDRKTRIAALEASLAAAEKDCGVAFATVKSDRARIAALEAATMDATKETEVLRKRNMELESQLTAATIEPTKKWECSSKDCPTLRHYKEHLAAAVKDRDYFADCAIKNADDIASLEKRLEHMTKAHDLIQQSLQKKKEEVESLRAGVSIMKVVNNDIMEISEGEKVQIPSILDWNLELYARRDTRVTILTREPSGAVIYRIEPRYPYMNYFEDVEFLGQELKGPMPKRLVDLLKELDFYKREVEGLRQGGAKVLEESTKLLKENEELKKESEEHLNAFRNETSLRIAEHEELERLRKMVK